MKQWQHGIVGASTVDNRYIYIYVFKSWVQNSSNALCFHMFQLLNYLAQVILVLHFSRIFFGDLHLVQRA